MTYEEFLNMPVSFIDDMAKLLIIKQKYRMSFTEEEKQINNYILTYWEEMKINELRYTFERCWDKDK
tara:strand:- start:265 stop:465 length:201 start_codon:yes stop_codon:yes gene_type:complete